MYFTPFIYFQDIVMEKVRNKSLFSMENLEPNDAFYINDEKRIDKNIVGC